MDIRYDDLSVGMDASNEETCEVTCLIGKQSVDIAQGVDSGSGIDPEQGAGDQGIMFGYATTESNSIDGAEGLLMPAPSSFPTGSPTQLLRRCIQEGCHGPGLMRRAGLSQIHGIGTHRDNQPRLSNPA